MAGGKIYKLLILALAGLFFLAGCSGVIYEKPHDDGGVSRLRLDGGESWSTYDTTPRYRSQKAKDQDDMCIMLKNESTF